MAGFPEFAWIRGALVPFSEARVSIADRGLLFGESVYEVLPITSGRVRARAAHLERLRRSATAIGLSCDDTHEASASSAAAAAAPWMDHLVAAEGVDEGLLYMQLTGGEAPRAHTARAAPLLFAYATAQSLPDRPRRAQGSTVVCAPDPRWARCDLKTTMLLAAVLGKRAAAAAGADDVLWIADDGSVREAGSANVAIVEGGVVVTPPPSPAILPGITIAIARRVAADLGIPWRHEPFDRARLVAADEVFVAATSQLVMPVLRVDDDVIADGRAGPIALHLGDALRDALDREA